MRDKHRITFHLPGGLPWSSPAITVTNGDHGHGWRADLVNCQQHAESAAQARAFAKAWLRAAELMDSAGAGDSDDAIAATVCGGEG